MIDALRGRFGVEPICRALDLPTSTYYAHKARQLKPSARQRRDEQLKAEIRRVYDANLKVYGARKVWRQLRRDGIAVARCSVERLMRELGLGGSSAARPSAPPLPTRRPNAPLTWSTATSARSPPTACGSPT
jgi:transposase InsO family protein